MHRPVSYTHLDVYKRQMLGVEKVVRLLERNVIEIAPLAYMRGRTPVSYTHLDVYKRQAQ